MSKIYDALRKAERDRGRPGGKPEEKSEVRAPRIRSGSVLPAGMDERFHRSLLNLKSAIDSEMKSKGSRVIMFTSAIEGEGKTTIIASLARVLASTELHKILMVDCSVRNPELHRLFGLENGLGLMDYLAGRAQVKDVTQSVDQGVLDLVSTGTIDSFESSQILLGSDRLAAFIKEAAAAYEYVLIDTSAILEAAETAILGSRADGIVMVIQAGRTRREVIKRAMSMVEKLEGKFIGTVLNRKRYYIPEFIYRRV